LGGATPRADVPGCALRHEVSHVVYFLLFALLAAAVAAWTDTRTGHVPNWLTYGGLGAGVLGHFVAGWRFTGGLPGALQEAGYSAGGAALCAAVPAFMYWRRAMGGGDLKLFAALGALCLPMVGLEVEMYSFVAAALIAPVRLAYKGMLLQTLGRSLSVAVNAFRPPAKRCAIPEELMTWFRLGPAIFLGVAATTLLHWNLP
jgi:prepilin peptidase CpaA